MFRLLLWESLLMISGVSLLLVQRSKTTFFFLSWCLFWCLVYNVNAVNLSITLISRPKSWNYSQPTVYPNPPFAIPRSLPRQYVAFEVQWEYDLHCVRMETSWTWAYLRRPRLSVVLPDSNHRQRRSHSSISWFQYQCFRRTFQKMVIPFH
jgi:hypothetical protein